jgi:outer membrane protein TolC
VAAPNYGSSLPPARQAPRETTASEHQGPISLRDAVRIALENNPDVRSQRARIDGAQATLASSAAALRPTLGFDLGVINADAPSTYLFKTIDAHDLPPGVDFNDPGTLDATEASLVLRWNLWNGGRDALGRDAARLGVEIARDNALAVENGLVQAVISAHLDARAASELVGADDASIAALEAQVAQTRSRVEGGSALRADLASLEVRLAEAEQRKLSNVLAGRLALSALRSLLALEPGAPIEIANDVPTAHAQVASLEQAHAIAMARRPELDSARQALARADVQLDSARHGFAPRLDFEARTWGTDTSFGLDLGDPNYTLALALHFDVFEGGTREATVQAARAWRAEMSAADSRAVLAVELEVETAWLRLDEAQARVSVSERAVAAAGISFGQVDSQFRGGATTVSRFLEAEAESARARTAGIGARLDLERAHVEFERAIGALLDDLGAGEEQR